MPNDVPSEIAELRDKWDRARTTALDAAMALHGKSPRERIAQAAIKAQVALIDAGDALAAAWTGRLPPSEDTKLLDAAQQLLIGADFQYDAGGPEREPIFYFRLPKDVAVSADLRSMLRAAYAAERAYLAAERQPPKGPGS